MFSAELQVPPSSSEGEGTESRGNSSEEVGWALNIRAFEQAKLQQRIRADTTRLRPPGPEENLVRPPAALPQEVRAVSASATERSGTARGWDRPAAAPGHLYPQTSAIFRFQQRKN